MTGSLGGRRIGIIGVGAMGGALCRGIVEAGAADAASVCVTDANRAAVEEIGRALGVGMAAGNREVARAADILLVAVKPHIVPAVLDEIREDVSADKLVMSIAAGVSLQALESRLAPGVPVVRAMPNTGAQIRAGATAFCPGSHATAAHAELAEAVFGAVGVAVQVEERLIDAVTGLSGSGPAYAYLIIEALIDGGVNAGLPRPIARRLATQTVLGAARMVDETGLHPGELKDMVTTPAGTTIAGLAVLEREGVRSALIQAVAAATARSKELGR